MARVLCHHISYRSYRVVHRAVDPWAGWRCFGPCPLPSHTDNSHNVQYEIFCQVEARVTSDDERLEAIALRSSACSCEQAHDNVQDDSYTI